MDAGAHLKKPWEDEEHHHHHHHHKLQSTAHLPATAAMPSIASTATFQQLTSPSATIHPSVDRRLPSINTAFKQQLHSPIEKQQSTFPTKYSQASHQQFPVHRFSPPEAPAKRPRLLYDPSHGPDGVNSYVRRSPPASTSDTDGSGSQPSEVFLFSSAQGDISSNKWSSTCSNCSDLKELVQNVISGLSSLDAELRQAMSGTIFAQSTKQETVTSFTTDVGEIGIRRSLLQAANNIEYNIGLVRDLSINRSLLPPMTLATPGSSAYPDQSSMNPSYIEGLKRKLELSSSESDPRHEDNKRFCPPTSTSAFEDSIPRAGPVETLHSSSGTMPETHRRGYSNDQQQPIPGQSPRRTVSSSGSVFGPSHSPMQAPPSSRMLPSPSSLHLPSSASVFPGMPSPPSQSAQAAHLQDLQHQISTKTLALQTLQREHDNLLAAFSRQQTRCATLDKKSQVSDNEINSLTEEKIRLQGQVEQLERQVEDLIKARDDAHKQSVANGAQYMQIMSHSSKLQAQGAADMKRWKAEKEDWERERKELQSRIQELEAVSPAQSTVGQILSSGGKDSSSSVLADRSAREAEDDTILSSDSLEVLRDEVIRLRRTCREMETTLQELGEEAKKIEQVMQDFGNIGKRISSKAGQSIHEAGWTQETADRGEGGQR